MPILEPCYIRLHYGEYKILMIEKPQKQQIIRSHHPKISFQWQEGLLRVLHPQLSHVLYLTSYY